MIAFLRSLGIKSRPVGGVLRNGRVIYQDQIHSGLQSIALPKTGVFIVKVLSEIGTTTQKIIIEN